MVCNLSAFQTEQTSLGLYLHTPFCRSKCPYCDFFSTVPGSLQEVADYPPLLIQELQAAAREWRGPLSSIFFGGGTPSLLPVTGIKAILDSARATFDFCDDIEISLEANPGTITPAYLAELRCAGINRLSLGVQALSDASLARLGRIHSHQETLDAITAARSAGFNNLSLDLIYSRPEQSLEQLRAELQDLLALQPQHLSCYGLTIEEGTPFARLQEEGKLALPKDEAAASAYLCVDEELSKAGFIHYEISNFARPGYECRHNLRYWQRQAYLGLGPGAHSLQTQNWGERFAVPADLALYQQHLAAGVATAESIEICDQQLAMAETLYLGLRTSEGVSDAHFAERFGQTIEETFPSAIKSCNERLIHCDGYWRFDLQGWLLYDHLITNFL